MALTTQKLRITSSGFSEPGPNPNPPVGLSAISVTPTGLTLNWKDNSRIETGFSIQQCTGAACTFGTPSGTWSPAANATSQAVTGLSENSLYSYRIKATGSSGDSAWVQLSDVLTKLSAPTGVSVGTIDVTTAVVSWTDTSSAETGFEIQVSPDLSFSTITTSATATTGEASKSVSGLTGSTNYYARVRAVRAANSNISEWAVSAQFTTAAGGSAPTAPSSVGYTSIVLNGVTVTWVDASSDETGFDVEIYDDAGFTSLVDSTTVAADVTSYAFTGLTTDTSYWARVRAVNTYGNSAWTDGAEVFVGAIPIAPSGVGFTSVTATGFTVTWTDNSTNETGFELQVASDAAFTTIVASHTPAASATSQAITGLTTYTKYWARVRAVNSFGNSSYASAGPQYTTFDVTLIGGLINWFDPDPAYITLDGSNNVQTWARRAGTDAVALTNATVANRPAYTATNSSFNNLPSVAMDTSTKCIQKVFPTAPNFLINFIFAFRKRTTATTSIYLFGFGGTGASVRINPTASGSGTPNATSTTIGPSRGSLVAPTSDTPINHNSAAPYIVSIFHNTTSSQLWVNGVEKTLVNKAALTGLTSSTSFGIPQYGAGNAALCEYGDFFMFDNTLTAQNRQIVEDYLRNKYNAY